jgi:hypothetical protein
MLAALNLVAGKPARDHMKRLKGLDGFLSFLPVNGELFRFHEAPEAVTIAPLVIAELHFSAENSLLNRLIPTLQ